MKSQRITIKSHNLEYLQSLACQMGIDDLAEVVNYLLLDCKGLGYQFGNKPVPTPQKPAIGYTFEPTFNPIQQNTQNIAEIDPIIARMKTLIEDF